MANLEVHEVETVQDAVRALAQEMLDPGTIPGIPKFTDLTALANFLDSDDMEDWLNETLDLVYDTLVDVSEALADAHNVAAGISVSEPNEERVNDLKGKLQALHEDIQGDENFHAALKLTSGLVTALGNRLDA